MSVSDVVVVGGGIGGASLAFALAREGLGVTLLEATAEYSDRVRGETIMPWGVQEARNLGVEDLLLNAGAVVSPFWRTYSEGVREAGDIPTGTMLDGISGMLNLGHPTACQALTDAAASAGARVIRGVHDVTITPGTSPTVSFGTSDGGIDEVTATLVVGADGRTSAVRRQAGISLEREPQIGYIAGLLVEASTTCPAITTSPSERETCSSRCSIRELAVPVCI
jgi:2-polyprenyl-6-methoxyphenol hydroxylase-like FAD-dependent oxidoreductase